jgi:hypothetical protein
MKSLSRLALAAVAILASAAFASAQTQSGVVNKLEVQRLVASGTPEANATLATHFAELADRYAADAARHKDMAQAYKANSNRSPATGAAAHCDRLAALATESAAEAREMVTYHEQLATGVVATVPRNAAKFDAGKGAPEPTAGDLHHLAMMAMTPAEHRSLEEYFTTLAKKNTADADAHAAIARSYRAGVHKGGGDPADHCDRLAKLAREAAKEATEAASLHRQLANIG